MQVFIFYFLTQLSLIEYVTLSIVHDRNILPSYWVWYCEHLNPSEFLFEGQLADNGCKVECIFLTSSSAKYNNFFDTSYVKHYNLEDGISCKDDHICHSGNCTPSDALKLRDEERGFAVIRNLQARVPDKDLVTKTDTFIRIYIRDVHAGSQDILVGKTAVIENNNAPIFKESFVSPSTSRSSLIKLMLFDSDGLNSDDYISTVYISIKNSPKHVQRLFPGGFVAFELTWVSEGKSEKRDKRDIINQSINHIEPSSLRTKAIALMNPLISSSFNTKGKLPSRLSSI